MFLQWRFFDGERLRDAEYTMIVRRELLHAEQRAEILSFSSCLMQFRTSLCIFFTNAAATSLCDERKHNRDKTFEKQKVLTVASASRNNMCNTVPSVAGSSCETAFDERCGRHAAAVPERGWPFPKRPEVLKRKRGGLWRDTLVSQEKARCISHRGDGRELSSCSERYWETLAAKASLLRTKPSKR